MKMDWDFMTVIWRWQPELLYVVLQAKQWPSLSDQQCLLASVHHDQVCWLLTFPHRKNGGEDHWTLIEILSDPPSYLYAVMPKLLMALGSMEMLEYTGWEKLTDQLHPCSYGEASFHESKDFTVQLLWIQPHPYRQNSSVLSKYKLIRFSSEL